MAKSDTARNPVCPNCNIESKSKYLKLGKFSIYLCKVCKNGFTYPVPKNISRYYPTTYLQFPGALANLRKKIHYYLQVKRKKWLCQYLKEGTILDIGAGEGVFGKVLGDKFIVTNIDTPTTYVKNKEVLKINFLKWKTNKKFDGIVFLESLEHVPNPQSYLKKAAGMTKKGGYILIECPRFGSFESKILGKYWLHLDLPRHLAHLSDDGIISLAKRSNLQKVYQKGVLIYEFSAFGLLNSLIQMLKIKTFSVRDKSIINLLSLLVVLMLLPFTLIIETILYSTNQAPIGLTVLRKK